MIFYQNLGNSKWRIQYGGRVLYLWSDSIQNWYLEVLEVVDNYESFVKMGKFKMVDPIWWKSFSIIMIRFYVKLVSGGFRSRK